MDFMDVNKDGFMDVAIADHCKGVFVYLGDGKGNWRTASSGLRPSAPKTLHWAISIRTAAPIWPR
jgi:hypothetical protein